ncbi:MAG TPA: hypothetical protein VEC37_13550, partial [Bacillota bacterium]|nr:hypothetical protein [Bacillota bacterium]
LYYIRLALRRGRKPAEIAELARLAPGIVEQLAELVALEKELTTYALYNLPVAILRQAKEAGFSDRYLAQLLAVSEMQVRDARNAGDIRANFFPVRPSGSAARAKSRAATYHLLEQSEMDPRTGSKVLLLGVDPQKTGAGLEFVVEAAARTLSEMGYQPVLVDSGPGALAGSKATFAGVYVEPVTEETVANLLEAERFVKVITDFSGGSDAGWLGSAVLAGNNTPALSIITDPVRLQWLLERVGLKLAEPADLRVDTGLAVEVIGDGMEALVTGTVEQIEEARINLEDSACSCPPYSLDREVVKQAENFAMELARELKVRGFMRVRFMVRQTRIGFIEMSLGASALTSFVTKATGAAWVDVATKAIMGVELQNQILPKVGDLTHTAVKEAVFSFNHFPDLDPVLGREIRSTGAVMGVAQDFGMAFLKSQLAAGEKVPTSGMVYLSIQPTDWRMFMPLAQQLVELGFELAAGEETATQLKRDNVVCSTIKQIGAGRPDILDWIKNGKVRWIISTPSDVADSRNEALIRSTAVAKGIPITTTFSAARAAVRGMRQYSAVGQVAKALQDYSFFAAYSNMRKD